MALTEIQADRGQNWLHARIWQQTGQIKKHDALYYILKKRFRYAARQQAQRSHFSSKFGKELRLSRLQN